jgi:hypothetical protein
MRILRRVGEFLAAMLWWLVGKLMAIRLPLVVLLVAAGSTVLFRNGLGELLTLVVVVAVIWWFVTTHSSWRARPRA